MFVDFERWTTFAYSFCGTPCKAHDTRTLVALGFLGLENVHAYQAALCKMLRVQQSNTSFREMVQIAIPLYVAFQGLAMRLMVEMLFNAAAREHDTDLAYISSIYG